MNSVKAFTDGIIKGRILQTEERHNSTLQSWRPPIIKILRGSEITAGLAIIFIILN